MKKSGRKASKTVKTSKTDPVNAAPSGLDIKAWIGALSEVESSRSEIV